jgi:hypothetical protein
MDQRPQELHLGRGCQTSRAGVEVAPGRLELDTNLTRADRVGAATCSLVSRRIAQGLRLCRSAHNMRGHQEGAGRARLGTSLIWPQVQVEWKTTSWGGRCSWRCQAPGGEAPEDGGTQRASGTRL